MAANLQGTALFLCLALATIAWASTTAATYALFVSARLILIVVLCLVLSILLALKPRAASLAAVIAAGIIFSGIYSWLLLRAYTEGQGPAPGEFFIWFVVSAAIAAALYASPTGKPAIPDRVAAAYLAFCLIIFLVTVFLGGIKFNGVPRFVFDFSSAEGGAISYSQGISKFYGLGAVLAARIATKPGMRQFPATMYAALLLLLLMLSLLGGGRGDFLAAMLLSLYCAGMGGVVKIFVFILVLVTGAVVGGLEYLTWFTDNSALWARYYALSSSLGMRDTLLLDSMELLLGQPRCLFMGCGIGYFQAHYGYVPGLYPHNVFAEAVISYGVILVGIMLVFLTYGLYAVYRVEGRQSLVLLIFAYFALIGMKSGSLVSSFWLVGVSAYLCAKGLSAVVRRG